MGKVFNFFIGIGLLSFLFVNSTNDTFAIDGHLRVTYPNGGESFEVGDTITIRWDASDNIDKIMLGYSFGPGSLNWIATSIPNTGSYTWKVGIGNTTNTKIKIDVTGYETGKGSLSDQSDGFFTVSKDEVATPTPRPTNTPIPTSIPTSTPAPVQKEEVKKSTPTPLQQVINIIETTIISITNIQISEYYYFEGSKTTDLSTVDPTAVEDFTLDREDYLYFMFIGITNLSSPEAVDIFQNLEEYVYFEYYYIWFEWEFWILFEETVEVTFYDSAQTLSIDSPVMLNGRELKEDEYKVEELENGEKKVIVEPEVIKNYVVEGEKIEISLKPSIKANIRNNEVIKTNSYEFLIEGIVSDTSNKVIIQINDEKFDVGINSEGAFEKLLKLNKGGNKINIMAFEKDSDESYAEISSVINVGSSIPSWVWIVGVLVVGGGALIGGFGIGWMLFRRK
jgi:hypothetical protein